MKRKVKLKAKGKRYYQNTHGKTYRVKAKPKPNTQSALKKRQRQISSLPKA